MRQDYRWLFWVGLLFVLAVGAGLSATIYQATLRQPQPRIQAVLAEALDEQFNPIYPVSTFGADDVFYLSVRTRHLRAHSIITVNWYYEDRLIHAQDQVVGAAAETYVLGFELLRTDGIWPAGGYRAEVLLNGDLVGAAPFDVMPRDA